MNSGDSCILDSALQVFKRYALYKSTFYLLIYLLTIHGVVQKVSHYKFVITSSDIDRFSNAARVHDVVVVFTGTLNSKFAI